jgi:hypothetical protein
MTTEPDPRTIERGYQPQPPQKVEGGYAPQGALTLPPAALKPPKGGSAIQPPANVADTKS